MTKNKLKLEIEKNFIYVKRADGEMIRYDLLWKRMERYSKKRNRWNGTCQQYEFFRGYSIDDLECKDAERFKELIILSNKINPRCESLSTFIARLHKALIYENYLREGIKAECYVSRDRYADKERYILTKPLEFYNKNIRAFFKKYDIEVSREIEKFFERDYPLAEKLVVELELSKIGDKEKVEFFKIVVHASGYSDSHFATLVNNFKYEMKSLINFIYGYLIPFENVMAEESLRLLMDYYSMANKIGRNVKKYPKYLRSMHDIITANYQAFKRDYDERKFVELMKPELELETKEFSILVPKTSKDIIDEGVQLNHCVSSYVDRILACETYIFFLRKTQTKEESLVTLELKGNKITQAKGSYNRPIIEEEKKFLMNYCKLKKIEMGV